MYYLLFQYNPSWLSAFSEEMTYPWSCRWILHHLMLMNRLHAFPGGDFTLGYFPWYIGDPTIGYIPFGAGISSHSCRFNHRVFGCVLEPPLFNRPLCWEEKMPGGGQVCMGFTGTHGVPPLVVWNRIRKAIIIHPYSDSFYHRWENWAWWILILLFYERNPWNGGRSMWSPLHYWIIGGMEGPMLRLGLVASGP